jgi:hypothetical protein
MAKKTYFSLSQFPGVGSGSPAEASDRIYRPGFEPTTFGQPPTPEDEQKVTRSKMEHLKRIMEERKARRRMRREAAAARAAAQYSTSWSVKSSEARPAASHSAGSSDNSSAAVNSASASGNGSGGAAVASSASPATSSDIFNPELEPVTA